VANIHNLKKPRISPWQQYRCIHFLKRYVAVLITYMILPVLYTATKRAFVVLDKVQWKASFC